MKVAVCRTSWLAALLVAVVSSSQAYHVSPPMASISRGGRSSSDLYSLKIRSSAFFGIGATRRSLQLTPSNSLRLTSVPSGENSVESEVKPSQVVEETNTSTNSGDVPAKSSTSLLQSIDKLGMKLKPMALEAYNKSTDIKASNVNGASSSQGSVLRSVLYSIKSNVLWMLYIFYRGYRGFFVILPAVFREVFRQLEESNLAVDAFSDNNREPREQPQPIRLRTRITVSVLSGILTLSYVVSGALRVLGKLCLHFAGKHHETFH